MKKRYLNAAILLAAFTITAWMLTRWLAARERNEQLHYDREETELIVSNLIDAQVKLYKTRKNLADTTHVAEFNGERLWLPRGNYFLRAQKDRHTFFLPIPVLGYRSGPDEGGAFIITLRPPPVEYPPRLLPNSPEFIYIPSGNFLLGDRLNPREPHYIWLTGFFMYPFEVTNAEFYAFLNDPAGYADATNWTAAGKRWKENNVSQVTALLPADHADYPRFGQPDQPIVWINWFEANAFCKWLTKKIGNQHWLFTLPNEAEWEKAARGPDNFDYGLGMQLSDAEISWYNWKKNPAASITVVGMQNTFSIYRPNRFGLYHLSGNVVEWTQSIHRAFSRQHPFVDDERNHDDTTGLRVARGGSWYSASIALLYLPYRDAFQPEHSSQDIGLRLVAKRLP